MSMVVRELGVTRGMKDRTAMNVDSFMIVMLMMEPAFYDVADSE